MSDDSQGLDAQIAKLSWHSPISPSRLEEILVYAGVSSECDRCRHNGWHYLTKDTDHDVMEITYLFSGEDDNKHDTMSYFTRLCLRCGNMQHYARVIIKSTEEKMMKQGQ